MQILKNNLKKYLDEVLFIELKQGKTFEVKGFSMDYKIPIPILVDELAKNIKYDELEVIPTLSIVKGLIYVLGSDQEFEHNSYYAQLLLAIDDEIVLKVLNDALKFASMKEYNISILYLNACRVIDSENLDVLYNLGRCYQDLFVQTESEEYENLAAKTFKQTIVVDTHFGLGYYQLGIYFYNHENYKKAEELWIEALKQELDQYIKEEIVVFLSKCRDRAVYEEGYTLILNGRIDEGLVYLKSIEEEHSDWWNLNFFIGLAYKMKEDYDTALQYFLKVMNLNTGHIQTMNEIGICLLSLGDFTEAIKYYKEAIRLEPLNAEIICNLGIVYLNQGEMDLALNQFEKAYEYQPNDEVISMWYEHIKNLNL